MNRMESFKTCSCTFSSESTAGWRLSRQAAQYHSYISHPQRQPNISRFRRSTDNESKIYHCKNKLKHRESQRCRLHCLASVAEGAQQIGSGVRCALGLCSHSVNEDRSNEIPSFVSNRSTPSHCRWHTYSAQAYGGGLSAAMEEVLKVRNSPLDPGSGCFAS